MHIAASLAAMLSMSLQMTELDSDICTAASLKSSRF